MENKNRKQQPTKPRADLPSEEREDPRVEIDTQFSELQRFEGTESGSDDPSLCDSEDEDSRETSPLFSNNCRKKGFNLIWK